MSGRYERKKPQKAGGLKKTVLIVVLVIMILIAALVVAAVVYYNSMLKKLNQVQVPTINYADLATEPTETTAAATEATAATVETTVAATEPHVASSADYINILLVGQASREGEAERFADTMILCTVNTYEKTVTLTSLLRDTLVQYPNYTDTNGKDHSGGKIKLTSI